MEIKTRHFLSNKDKKKLQQKLISVFGEQAETFFSKSDRLEIGKTESDEEYILNDGKIWFFYYEGQILPSIMCLRQSKSSLPKITVDVGAIRFVLNGADIMAPGVTYFDDEIEKGSFIAVTEEKNDTIIAIGQALVDAKTFREKGKGKVVKNIHHLKDIIWNFQL
ncbi:MAG: DUF1947 domain-containing protein [Candidatus Heimdallarchaeaceae archaeon]